MKINGNTVGTTIPRSNYNQTDPKKADYLVGRENIVGKNELATITEEILAEAKESGEFDGQDGISPVVSVEEIEGGHRVVITDKNGTQTFDVLDGRGGTSVGGGSGADGFSPIVSVTEIEGGHQVSITDKNGTNTFDVKNGLDGNTPVKGTDYWTTADREQMVNDVLNALPMAYGEGF